jgi:glycosyltransferase involved in cell wall biosynthesis
MLQKGKDLYGFHPDRGRVIPLGLHDRPVSMPANDGKIRFVTVGRAEDRKGTDLLIAALANVLPNNPSATFQFIGPYLKEYLATRPDLRERWDKLVTTCPGRVVDRGMVSESERDTAVGMSHWLVTPSRFESFGIVAVEAMRAGTPVVYAAAGGLGEVGSVCNVNVAIKPEDASDLERALMELCRQGPGQAHAARSEARRAYEKHFSASVMADRTLDAYDAALRLVK